MRPTPDNDPQTVMGKVLLLLEPFRESHGLTLTELAERTGFPRSTTHRMLLQLVEVEWLRRDGLTYHLGPKMAELGSLAQSHDRVHHAAVAVMYQLHQRTRMAVHLTVLEGDDVLYLEMIGGRWAAATLPTRVGQRRPALDTAEGAALLALRDEQQQSAHEREFRSASGEHIHCVAIAFDADRDEIAALSLTGMAGRIPEDAGHRLSLAADMIAAQLSA